MSKYAIGIDFGTESGRVAVVDVATGEVVSEHVTIYKHGVMTTTLPNATPILKRDTALQHPQDYVDVLLTSIPQSLAVAKIDAEAIIGLGLDFTACTILPVDANLTPLCFQDKWQDNPHAWVKLWKHHAAEEQAVRINRVAKERSEPWLPRYGGSISAEWFLPKLLEVLEEAPAVYEEAAYFIEAGDWLTSLMTGQLRRNSCAAGYKGMWHKRDGFVKREFLQALHPQLEDIYTNKLAGEVLSIGQQAGYLTAAFAEKTGLPVGTPVAMGLIDAHAAVPGAGVTGPDTMVLVMGTSSCHMVLSDRECFVPGISGVVEDGIIPGYYAYEAGQAAVGDIFAWYTKEMVPAYVLEQAERAGQSVHQYLEDLAAQLEPGANGLLALDWQNGCRTPLVDPNLTGVILGLTLATKPEEIYRGLIEATAYGTKLIIEQFQQVGILIKELVACGGLPHKNKLMMQIYADVTGMPISVAESMITPAIGSAMYGAVAAGRANGGYDTITEAAEQMSSLRSEHYKPRQENKDKYAQLYAEYVRLVDYFGRGENDVLKLLRAW